MDIVLEKAGYKYRYTARVVDEKDSNRVKETIYYLKPDSKKSQTGTLYGQARINYIIGDIYDRHHHIETLVEGTRYQLEPSKTSDDASMTLVLIIPTS